MPVDHRKELDEFGTKDARLESRAGVTLDGDDLLSILRNLNIPRIFVSYSHVDEKHLNELKLHLKILKNLGLIDAYWHDRRIQPGWDWDSTIQGELQHADVILFLTSNTSLASDYINSDELKPALERYVNKKAIVVPIILERCPWVDVFAANPVLAALKDPKRRVPQAIPRDGVPIRSYKPIREGWAVVAEELKTLFTEVKAEMAGKEVT